MRINAAWLLLSLSSALSLPAGIAIAQDGTVVPKSPPTTGTVAPQTEPSYDAAEPAPGEINQGAALTIPPPRSLPANTGWVPSGCV